MTLQNIFYIVGIITMVLYAMLLIAGIVLIFYFKSKFMSIIHQIESKVKQTKEIIEHPKNVIREIGYDVVDNILLWVSNATKSKKKD